MDKALIIVPAFNEEQVILKTASKLEEFCQQNSLFQYIIVDDGSNDNTLKILKDNNFNYLSHPINLGIGEPFKTGIKYGLKNGYTRFINFDADGQHRLDNLQYLVDVQNVDYVVGSRFVEKKKPLTFRMLGSRVLSLSLLVFAGMKVQDPTSGLILINNQELAKFYVGIDSNKPEPSLYPKLKDQFKIKEIQVLMDDRAGGESHFNIYNSLHFMLEQIFMIIVKG